MNHPDTLQHLRSLISEVEFAQSVRRKLTGVRLISESDMETFERVMKLACKMICWDCRGYGHGIGGSSCDKCGGNGHLKVA